MPLLHFKKYFWASFLSIQMKYTFPRKIRGIYRKEVGKFYKWKKYWISMNFWNVKQGQSPDSDRSHSPSITLWYIMRKLQMNTIYYESNSWVDILEWNFQVIDQKLPKDFYLSLENLI